MGLDPPLRLQLSPQAAHTRSRVGDAGVALPLIHRNNRHLGYISDEGQEKIRR